MKKSLTITLALILCCSVVLLVGCGSDSSAEEKDVKSSEETATEPKFDFSNYDGSLDNETVIEKVLLDNETLTIALYSVGVNKAWGFPQYAFRIVNKTDEPIGLRPKDGIMMVDGNAEPFSFGKAESGSKFRIIGAKQTEDVGFSWDIEDGFSRGSDALARMINTEGTIELADCSSLPDVPVIAEYSFSAPTAEDPTMK